jgi:excisionase family DNA binding protein
VKLITTSQAAIDLGVTSRRVLALIHAGRLPAQKMGRDYFIEKKDLAKVRVRKPGRPAKRRRAAAPEHS